MRTHLMFRNSCDVEGYSIGTAGCLIDTYRSELQNLANQAVELCRPYTKLLLCRNALQEVFGYDK